jgi:hypothetical protein
MKRHSPFVKGVLEVLLELKQVNTLLESEQVNTLLKLEQINTLEPKKTYTLQELEEIHILLKLKRADTIVSLACTCKTILEICTKKCEDRLRTLLKSDPNNINLVLYKSIQKWYLFNDSPIPLRCIISSLLRCPAQKKIRVTLPSRKFIVHNITISYPERVTLCLYNTSIDELLSQTPDNEIHTLTLCDCPGIINFLSILIAFPSLINLKLIRTTVMGGLPTKSSTFNLVTLSIIECDITQFYLNDWMLQFLKLQKLKWVNNIWNTNVIPIVLLSSSIHSVSITHTKSEALLINTINCGREVFIK